MSLLFVSKLGDTACLGLVCDDLEEIACIRNLTESSDLHRCGRPSGPENLRNHNCLKISTVDGWNAWRFHSNGEDLVVPAAGNFEANSADAVYHATLAGLGIARLSTYLVSGDLRSGRLIQLLNDHVDDDAGIYAVYSSRHHLSPKVRVFIDYLAEALGPIPPWEHEQAT